MRDELQEAPEDLRDALDHIWRVARSSRTGSRRDRWIAARALSALEGTNDWQQADYPKVNVPKNVDRIAALTAERDELRVEVERQRKKIRAADAGLSLMYRQQRDRVTCPECGWEEV